MKQHRFNKWHTLRMTVPGIIIVAGLNVALAGSPGNSGSQKPQGTTSNDSYRPFLINNIFNYYGNNGAGSYNKFTTAVEGFEFPKGSGKTAVYEDGIVWGGYCKNPDTLKVGGSVYIHGLQAGAILTAGTSTSGPIADDPSLAKNRVYRVRPDINPTTPFADVENTIATEEVAYIGRYETVSAQDIYNQYIQDWNEWPADAGAPYTDVNHDGVYDPAVDLPGQPGAHQTLWYVDNDLNPAKTLSLAGSTPIGLEMQRTVWGFKNGGTPANVVFTTTVLINKSGARIDSMYIVQWSDPDLGDGANDFVGCDTSRQMGYVYNGTPTDAVYGVAVPAVGYSLLQGPRVPSPGDSALFRGERRPGFKNLPMTRFVFFTQGDPALVDPVQGAGGYTQWYRLMNGFTASTGSPFIDPTTSQPTKFCLSGDPVQATDGSAGWVDGTHGLTPQDRRMCLVSGPFTMADGDTQEVVVGTMAAQGADRLSSITLLRNEWKQVNDMYGAIVTSAPVGQSIAVPLKFGLDQNYPNPFNPATVIQYSLPQASNATLRVFNILGQEVATLVNAVEPAGTHRAIVDGKGLASGVYIYRLQAGSFTDVKRMVLLK